MQVNMSSIFGSNEKVMIVTDENVAEHYLTPLKEAIEKFGYSVYERFSRQANKQKIQKI